MIKKTLIVVGTLTFAFLLLFISILRTASVRYDFSDKVLAKENVPTKRDQRQDEVIGHYYPYPGSVLPDSMLWPLKAFRDRLWLIVTTDDGKEAELYLLFADKRIAASKVLFERGDSEIGYTTLTKAEKYLELAVEKARDNTQNGMQTADFLQRLARASLKHYQTMEEILVIAPEDARPQIIYTQNYAKDAYESVKVLLMEKNVDPPPNPFSWK